MRRNKERLDDRVDGFMTKNIFNKNDIIKGSYISSGNVVIEGTSPTGLNCHTDYIEVLPNETYYRNKLSNALMYDENYTLLNYQTTIIGSFTTSAGFNNIKYVRMSIREVDIDTFQLELGSVETSYEPYGIKINALVLTDVKNLQDDVSTLQSLNQNIPEYFQNEILYTVQSVESCTTNHL